MTRHPTARRFTGASPTQAVLLGDAPFPSLLADRGRDLEALPQRTVGLGDGPYRPRGQEGSATTTITRDCPGSLTRGSSRRTNPSSTTPTTATGWEREKGSSLNSASLTAKPLASGVYVHVPEAASPHERSISVMSLFPSPTLGLSSAHSD